MKLVSNSFNAAIEYLSHFRTDDNTPLLFRPAGDSVVISINGKAYAEYRCTVDAPLAERFAMPLRIPSRLAKELPEDVLIQFKVGSHVKMLVGTSSFTSPILDVLSLQDPPKVIDGVAFNWDADVFIPELRAAVGHTLETRHADSKSCVLIEVLPARETIVATNGAAMSWYEQKANAKNEMRRDDDALGTILLHRANVPMLLATCKSLGEVSIELGLSHLVVECGRRKSILPVFSGAFPKWREVLKSVLDRPVAASVCVDRDKLIHAVRTVRPEAQVSGSLELIVHAHDVELRAESEAGGMARTVIATEKPATKFGPLQVSASMLLSLCSGWPDEVPVWIEHRGTTSPLVFRRPRFRALLMPMIPKETKDEESAVPNTDSRRVATSRSEESARVLGDAPDRRGLSGFGPMPADDVDAGSGQGRVDEIEIGSGAGALAP
jgi:DNA polymerase III sliding clamp (beta) subunit (PCNA family)